MKHQIKHWDNGDCSCLASSRMNPDMSGSTHYAMVTRSINDENWKIEKKAFSMEEAIIIANNLADKLNKIS